MVGWGIVAAHILHDNVQRLFLVSSSPFPAFTTGLGKFAAGLTMVLEIFTLDIDTILLNVVFVIAKAIEVLFRQLIACLYQLVILVVAHHHRGINGTRKEEIDIAGKAYPLVVHTLLLAHYKSKVVRVRVEYGHLLAFHLQWISIPSRY